MARAITLWALLASTALAGGNYYEYTEAVSARLPIGVTFTLWVPEGVTTLRGVIVVTWQADADFESGLRGFVVLRDGKEVAQVPEKPVGRFGRPLFQTMSYHDTPEKPLPAMRWLDKAGTATSRYEVIAINSVGLRSKPGR